MSDKKYQKKRAAHSRPKVGITEKDKTKKLRDKVEFDAIPFRESISSSEYESFDDTDTSEEEPVIIQAAELPEVVVSEISSGSINQISSALSEDGDRTSSPGLAIALDPLAPRTGQESGFLSEFIEGPNTLCHPQYYCSDTRSNLVADTDNSFYFVNSSPEPRPLKKYASTYELEVYKKNAMIIFNHDKFSNGKLRLGSDKDETALSSTFREFGFEIVLHPNLSKKNLLHELEKFTTRDFTSYGCICVAILTEGRKKGNLMAYDTRYTEHDVIDCFDGKKNPTLVGKPILILIQACRGANPASAVQPANGNQPESPVEFDDDCEEHYFLPTESDMLIFHSAYVGRASARVPQQGSWFIQTLCEKINQYASTLDLESIFRKVKMAVALDKEAWVAESATVAKQMPVVTSTLIRELYLIPRLGKDLSNRSTSYVDTMTPCSSRVRMVNQVEVGVDATDGFALTQWQISPDVLYMPCACFLEYFTYIKNCLRLFIRDNQEDRRAHNIMETADEVGAGLESNNIRFLVMNQIWAHLNNNNFPMLDYMFFYKPY